MTPIQKLQLRYGIRWFTGFIDWRLVRESIYAVTVVAIFFWVLDWSLEIKYAYDQYQQAIKITEQPRE